MKAIIYRQYGDESVLEMTDLPIPQIGADEVLIKVYVAALNPKDVVIRKGLFKIVSGNQFPKQTAFDFSGVVVEVGANVTHLNPNDEVFGFLDGLYGGAAAEYLKAPANTLVLKPKNLSFEEAAALPLVSLTALQSLRDDAQAKAREHVCIQAASGGVGSVAVQIAKEMELVVTSISSTRNLAFCKELGADYTLSYQDTNVFQTDLKFDIFYQVFGRANYWTVRKRLTSKGRFVTLIPTFQRFILVFLTRFLPIQRACVTIVRPNTKDLNLIKEWVEFGKLKPIVDSVFPLEDIQAAHRHIDSKHARGKVLLSVVK